jgi:glucose/arabinose dehydrogenase
MRAPLAVPAAAAALVLAGLLTGCSDEGEPAATPLPSATPSASESASGTDGSLRPQVAGTVIDGLDAPWGLAFLPDGDALVSQRDEGTLVQVTPDGEASEVGEVPGVVPGGEGGLMGVAVSPAFDSDRTVFVYTTAEDDNRVLAMTLTSEGLGEPRVVVDGIEKSSIHNGGRIAFGPDGHLYVATGDAGDTSLAQDTGSLNGKILRMTPDGEPVADNLRDDSLVYSLGHRNVQGLAWDSRGRLWASEFGQNTWDELNLIEAGGNYGWPVVEGDQPRGDETGDFIEPAEQWSTDEASPSGIAVVDDTVLMAGLRGERLWVVPIDAEGSGTGEPRAVFDGDYGRLRTVAAAPDGSVWLMTSNTDGRGDVRNDDDRILRLTY